MNQTHNIMKGIILDQGLRKTRGGKTGIVFQ